MSLLTAEILAKLPAMYETDGMRGDHPVACKLFTPWGYATWYILEGEQDEDGDWMLFAFVAGLGEDELGYVSLRELESVRGRFGLGVERDLYFPEGQTLRDVAPEFCARLWPAEDEQKDETTGVKSHENE